MNEKDLQPHRVTVHNWVLDFRPRKPPELKTCCKDMKFVIDRHGLTWREHENCYAFIVSYGWKKFFMNAHYCPFCGAKIPLKPYVVEMRVDPLSLTKE